MMSDRDSTSGIPPTSPEVEEEHGIVDDNDNDNISGANAPPVPVPPMLPTRDTSTSTLLGQINAARRGTNPPPRPVASMSAQSGVNQDILAKMRAFHLSRKNGPPQPPHSISTGTIPTSHAAELIPNRTPSSPNIPLAGPMAGRIPPPAVQRGSVPVTPVGGAFLTPPKPGGLAQKRKKPNLKLSDATGPAGVSPGASPATGETAFSKYSEYIDTKAGTLKFKNKAILHGGGIEFSSGQTFSISLDEVDRLDELGKGNYGTVYKVRHSRPHLRKPGMGLRGIVSRPEVSNEDLSTVTKKQDNDLTGVIMAMKEIRLELDEGKFAQIIMELDILHRCVSPFIIDFYGAFFQEGAVYICVEYMDGGSIDKLYEMGIPENILRKIVLSTVMGLRCLKDDHNIIHRDVKPTNILVNTRGQIKICDFGVSGNLVASIARTNIGCQSYMAPERIAGGGMQQSGTASTGSYSVQSDIWSLGLSIIECAIGRYPYPPETYNNIFSQLHAIVHGDPPTLPESGYSDEAHAFVKACLDKVPSNRPTYAKLLRHPWLAPLMQRPEGLQNDEDPTLALDSHSTEDKEVADWVIERLEHNKQESIRDVKKPALHAVALDAVPGSPLLDDPSSITQKR